MSVWDQMGPGQRARERAFMVSLKQRDGLLREMNERRVDDWAMTVAGYDAEYAALVLQARRLIAESNSAASVKTFAVRQRALQREVSMIERKKDAKGIHTG